MEVTVFLRRRVFSKRYFHGFILVAAIVAIIRYATLYDDCADEPVDLDPASIQAYSANDSNRCIHLGAIVCGGVRADNVLVMVKSALMFGTAPLHLHLFTNDACRKLKSVLDDWQTLVTWRKFTYMIHSFNIPKEWIGIGPPCSAARWLIPDWITTVDAMLVVDTDVIFLRPIDDFWLEYSRFNQSHIAGLSEAGFDWYTKTAKIPTYKQIGLSAGMMLMNLTRMRAFGFSNNMQKVLNKYRKDLGPGAEQDIVSILFSYFPEKLYVFGCEWNYQPTHCINIKPCKKAERDGASALHPGGGFHRGQDNNAFKVAYEVFKRYKFGSDMKKYLYEEYHFSMGSTVYSTCHYRYNVFLKALHEYFITSVPTPMPHL